MLTPDEAWQAIAVHCPSASPSWHDLDASLGHVLAESVGADRDLPASARSAMDGFAVRATDFGPGPTVLRVTGEVPAGTEPQGRVGAGECVRIFTGASVPLGADSVAIIEDTRPVGEDGVAFLGPVKPGANILQQGEDARAGDELLPVGTHLAPAHLAVAAAVGKTRLRVHSQPRVAVLTTGRELLPPTVEPLPHQIRDSNATLLAATLASHGFSCVLRHRLSDDLEAIAGGLHEALEVADAVLISGGVSVGDYDFVPAAVARLGCRVVLHGVAMKPGKPILFATHAPNKVVFGLPGNPLSAMTGLHEFVLPALRRMSGLPVESCRPGWTVRLLTGLHSKPGRHRFHLARLTWTAAGLAASPVESRSSADLVAGGRADGAIIVPPDVEFLAPGTYVTFRPWKAAA
jgi:molybdopterin molybdotransferase